MGLLMGLLLLLILEIEIATIELALSSTKIQPYFSVNTHLDTVLKLLFDKKQPDYRNSIKLSISTIE